jgi:hypothetical protein
MNRKLRPRADRASWYNRRRYVPQTLRLRRRRRARSKRWCKAANAFRDGHIRDHRLTWLASSRLVAGRSQATGPALAGTSDDHPTAGGYITYLAGRRPAALRIRNARVRRSLSLLSRSLHVCHWKPALRQPTPSACATSFTLSTNTASARTGRDMSMRTRKPPSCMPSASRLNSQRLANSSVQASYW